MNNTEVISTLKECIEKLKIDIERIAKLRDAIPYDTNAQIQQRKVLNSVLAQLIAEESSMRFSLNEREAQVNLFPPLDDEIAQLFLAYLNVLNQVIKDDQKFDQFVVIAKGIGSAANGINKIT